MKGLRIVLIIIGITLSRCGLKSDDGPKAEPVEVKYYKESETQQLSNQASADLGVLVTLEDNKDFRNEYKYKYVLSLLKKYRADIIKIQTDIEKIVIGSQTAIRDNKGKSVVYVNLGIVTTERLWPVLITKRL